MLFRSVMQAECAGTKPLSCMNPILLKPTSDMGSQVILNGEDLGNMKAMDYFNRKKDFIPEIKKAYDKLAENYDIIVIEGAGSPVELNLKKDDIVNMGLAKMIDVPVLLVGDIDRGGIFPQLLGTLDLLEKDERPLIKGLIVNKFRGDARLFEDGVKVLGDRGKTKVVGVVPYIDVKLDDEDSLSDRFYVNQIKDFDIAVIRLNHISNFTDFDTFEQLPGVSVRYVKTPSELGNPDIIIIPGSKNTLEDLNLSLNDNIAPNNFLKHIRRSQHLNTNNIKLNQFYTNNNNIIKTVERNRGTQIYNNFYSINNIGNSNIPVKVINVFN